MQRLLHFLQDNQIMQKKCPLYIHIARNIERAIYLGMTPADGYLPPERFLADTLQVSRITIGKAFTRLEEQGLILREQGRGTKVLPNVNYSLNIASGFSKQLRQKGGVVGNHWLLRQRIRATSQIAQWLDINEGELIAYLKRVRLANGCPVSLEITYVPLRYLPEPELLEDSLYDYWQARGIMCQHAEHTIKAVTCEPDDAVLLQINPGTPLLLCNQVTRNEQHEILEYSQAFCRGDVYELKLAL